MKPEEYSNLSLTEAVELLYPNHAELFVYDTAKPQQLLDKIVDEYLECCYFDEYPVTEEMRRNKRAEIYGEVRLSVFAYGKNHGTSNGMVPLTNRCREILNYVSTKWGYNLIFTPTLENLRPTQVKVV